MPSYKALYQQELKKNKEHEEKIYELESKIVDLVDVRDIAEILGEDPEVYMNECCAYTLAKKIKEHREMEEENKKLKEENEKQKLMIDRLPNDMDDKWWCEKIKRWRWDGDPFEEEEESEEESDEESEEETDKYDGDDWGWVYGKMTVKNDDGFDDVVLCMAGGGDHWENWIMRPSMNYIKNKNGLHPQHGKDLIQSSCGNYVSFQDKDYVPDDGECIVEYEIAVEC